MCQEGPGPARIRKCHEAGPIIAYYEPCHNLRQKRNVTAFYFCKFFQRPSRDQRETPRAEGGERGALIAFHFRRLLLVGKPPARCRFLLRAKNIPLKPRWGKRKGEVFRLRQHYPGSQLAKKREPVCTWAGECPWKELTLMRHRRGKNGPKRRGQNGKSAISASKCADLNGGFRADVVSTRSGGTGGWKPT